LTQVNGPERTGIVDTDFRRSHERRVSMRDVAPIDDRRAAMLPRKGADSARA
jgi:hypothetical protein